MWEEWPPDRTAAERPYWLAFSLLESLGTKRISQLIEHFGSLERAWRQGDRGHWRGIPHFGEELAGQVRKWIRQVDPTGVEVHLARRGSRVLIPPEPDYPALLRQIPSPPATLYVRGRYDPAWFDRAVAVVGTRHPSREGPVVASRLGRELADNGITVVSGMAMGIDGAAHRGALEVAEGRTVAVLAGGTDRPSPPCQRDLYGRIRTRGLVVSEYPDGTEPIPHHFPARNRIISGLCAGVVVVEAPQSSGALITVDFALEQGREVFAVPGSILVSQSEGTHHLLRQGSRLAAGVGDILDELNWGVPLRPRPGPRSLPLLADEEEPLYRLLEKEGQSIERLIRLSGIPAGEVARIVTQLEVKGAIRKVGASRYASAY